MKKHIADCCKSGSQISGEARTKLKSSNSGTCATNLTPIRFASVKMRSILARGASERTQPCRKTKFCDTPKHIVRILITLAVIAVLAAAFFYGDNAAKTRETPDVLPSVQTEQPPRVPQSDTPADAPSDTSPSGTFDEAPDETPADASVDRTEQPPKNEPPVPSDTAPDVSPEVHPDTLPDVLPDVSTTEQPTEPPTELPPVETPDSTVQTDDEAEYTCFLSVRCDTVLANMDKLAAEKAELVPADGVLFAEREVIFYEEESVFNVLAREMKQKKIHFEFVRTPVFDSAYIEGIANLYEFDCGELSGWLYRVNGEFPGYGCSRYTLSDGDRVEVVYTCDSGADVGAVFDEGGGQKDA